jgi:hopanoid biosynthesis associated radical SAM protein HpnH
MLEPLFSCNLSCAGCGKIKYPPEILNRQLTVAECLASVDECGAPVVSIAGGEPLLHPAMPQIVAGIVRQKRFAYLCTNGLLLQKRIHQYSPSSYFTFSIHLDGGREHHDRSVSRAGVFDVALEAVKTARGEGFRVTINCTLYDGATPAEVAEFFDFVTDLGIEGITVAPGFHYEKAANQEVFLRKQASKQLFREIFRLGRGRRWAFNHTGLYLDFLAGNQTYQCTPWGTPTRNVLGWQQPCYLLMNEGHVASFQELLTTTDWSKYGTGRNPKCGHCMLHSGFEATAVNDTLSHPLKALGAFLRGPRLEGPMAPELLSGDTTVGASQEEKKLESTGL